MDLIPRFNLQTERLDAGEAFTANEYCLKESRSRCLKYYQGLKSPGTYRCPYGFTSVATQASLAENCIYTSLVIKEHSEKPKGKGYIKNIFEEREVTRLIGLIEQKDRKIEQEKQSSRDEVELITALFHEIRKLSRDLDTAGTALQRLSRNQDELSTNVIDNVLQTINLIMIRVNHFELMKNPRAIIASLQANIPVYKKFDKIRFILRAKVREKECKIVFENESYFTINGYEVFDVLPYILLDNAVKYTPRGKDIFVTFEDKSRVVEIKSLGPPISESEKERLGERGFRAKSVCDLPGTGTGLSFMQEICHLHRIRFEYICGMPSLEIEGREYSYFTVRLQF